MIKIVRGALATALLVVMVGCGAESESESESESAPPTTTSELTTSTAGLPPISPTPVTFVWKVVGPVDFDSRPIQIARAYVESWGVLSGLVGLDHGYPGFERFSGTKRNPNIVSGPALYGTKKSAVAGVTARPDPIGTRYVVTVCTDGSGVSQWLGDREGWHPGNAVAYTVDFSIPGPVIPWESPSGAQAVDVSDRTQEPTVDVFGDAVFHGYPYELDSDTSSGGMSRAYAACAPFLPAPSKDHRLPGPLPAEPWYPGWAKGANHSRGV